MTKFYVDSEGRYLGGWDGSDPPPESIEVPFPPPNATYIWNGTEWNPPPPNMADNASIITESFNASLRRKAAVLQSQGNTFEAVQLLLQAQGVQT